MKPKILMLREDMLNSGANMDVYNAYLTVQMKYAFLDYVACKS